MDVEVDILLLEVLLESLFRRALLLKGFAVTNLKLE